jgi:hypothetical protein
MFLINLLSPKKIQDGCDEDLLKNYDEISLLMINLFKLFYIMKFYYYSKVVMMLNLLINLGEFETHKRP